MGRMDIERGDRGYGRGRTSPPRTLGRNHHTDRSTQWRSRPMARCHDAGWKRMKDLAAIANFIGSVAAIGTLTTGIVQGVFLKDRVNGTYWLAYSAVLLIAVAH